MSKNTADIASNKTTIDENADAINANTTPIDSIEAELGDVNLSLSGKSSRFQSPLWMNGAAPK